MTARKPKRWTSPRFRLRTLMLVIFPLAVAIVAFAIRFEKAERQRPVVDWIINDEHGHAVYDFGGSPPWTNELESPQLTRNQEITDAKANATYPCFVIVFRIERSSRR